MDSSAKVLSWFDYSLKAASNPEINGKSRHDDMGYRYFVLQYLSVNQNKQEKVAGVFGDNYLFPLATIKSTGLNFQSIFR